MVEVDNESDSRHLQAAPCPPPTQPRYTTLCFLCSGPFPGDDLEPDRPTLLPSPRVKRSAVLFADTRPHLLRPFRIRPIHAGVATIITRRLVGMPKPPPRSWSRGPHHNTTTQGQGPGLIGPCYPCPHACSCFRRQAYIQHDFARLSGLCLVGESLE